jgi:(5-formylfuran-3-yl)methyl phosphate synthase
MHLLVSVSDAAEAVAALAGGADIIDAKDPGAGALGAVAPRVLREIRTTVGEARPVTAAIGDAADEVAIERLAHESAAAGATLVKVGFAGIDGASRVAALLGAAIRGASAASDGLCGVVAVAYADPGCDCGIGVPRLMNTSARAGARGVLVDTWDKSGPSLCQLASPLTLSRWVAEAHDLGLTIALAGRLTAGDLTVVREAGADIAGVRGAACDDGRTGRVSADRVRLLVDGVVQAFRLASS